MVELIELRELFDFVSTYYNGNPRNGSGEKNEHALKRCEGALIFMHNAQIRVSKLKDACSAFKMIEIVLGALKINRSITNIDFSNNALSDKEALLIAESLRDKECTWVALNLSHNELTDEGLRTIIDATKDNTTLKELNLENNNCYLMSKVFGSLECNHSIEYLHMGRFVPNRFKARVYEWLDRNKRERLIREENRGNRTKACV